jgi:hypothetical protein
MAVVIGGDESAVHIIHLECALSNQFTASVSHNNRIFSISCWYGALLTMIVGLSWLTKIVGVGCLFLIGSMPCTNSNSRATSSI